MAVVIDDDINTKNTRIQNILKQITLQNIPVQVYEDIPSDEVVFHFQGLSFVLLDWCLSGKDLSEEDRKHGVSRPELLKSKDIERNIKFIEQLCKVCYCPIFIFTDEPVDYITSILVSHEICVADRPSNILVKSKFTIIYNAYYH